MSRLHAQLVSTSGMPYKPFKLPSQWDIHCLDICNSKTRSFTQIRALLLTNSIDGLENMNVISLESVVAFVVVD
jgi:hypothetical protein